MAKVAERRETRTLRARMALLESAEKPGADLVACEREGRSSPGPRQVRTQADRRAEDRFAAFLGNLPGMAFMKEAGGRYVYANETFERIAHLSRGGACGRTDRNIWPDELADSLRTGDWLVATRGVPIETLEEFPHAGGVRKWLLTKFPVPGMDASPPVVAGVAIDVTAHQQSEDKVRQERDRAQTYLDVAGVAIIAFDPLGTVTLINRKGCELLECDELDVVGRNWFTSFVPERARAAARRSFQRFARAASSRVKIDQCPSEAHDSFESLVLTAGGRERTVAWHVSRMSTSSEGGGVLASGEDVTRRKALEEELQRSRRMEAIGRLAGGVAHDFNNLLTPIIGYCERLLGKLKDDDAREQALHIMNAGQMAAALTRSLLAFGRGQPTPATAIDVNAVIENMNRLLACVVGDDIIVDLTLASDLGSALAGPAMLEQVIMNMIVNSSDAMPDGGRITIETRNVEVTADDAGPVGVEPGSYVTIRVSDTGCGMDERTMSRVFEPFFTTKERGRGTGLGLSTVYGIVRNTGGRIWVESAESKGTTFNIFLKRVDGPPEVEPLPVYSEHADASPGGSETVLIAEDNDVVRILSRAVLSDCGYNVLEASGGDEALNVSRLHDGPVHVLLADIVMPGMGGRELFNRLADERPGLRALFVSGYAEDAIAKGGRLPPGTAFQEKPFGPETLARKVRAVLDAPPQVAGQDRSPSAVDRLV